MVLDELSRYVMVLVSELEWLQVIIKQQQLQLQNKLGFYLLIGNPQNLDQIQLLWKEKSLELMLEDWLNKGRERIKLKLLEIWSILIR
jgi:hypothetical protein